MDKQNSKGSINSRLHPFAILQHGLEVKKQIQNDIFKLIAILKKREHDLCLEVDQLCLELLYEAEESEKTVAAVLTDPNCEVDVPKQYLKKQDLLTTKLIFTADFKDSQYMLKTYGHLQKIDCRKIVEPKPKTLFTVQKGPVKSFEDRFKEMLKPKVDGVERKASSAESLKNEGINCENLENRAVYGRKHDQELQYVRDRVTGDRIATLEETCALFRKESPPTSSSTNQTSLSRMPNYDYWLDTVKGIYPSPTCTNRIQKKNEWLADAGREFPETSADGEMQTSSRDTHFVVSPESSNDIPAEMAGGDNPQNTIKACFGEYLKKDDLKLWLSLKSLSDVNDGSSSEDEDSGFCKVTRVDLTDEMIDSFCFIADDKRRKTGNIVATAVIP